MKPNSIEALALEVLDFVHVPRTGFDIGIGIELRRKLDNRHQHWWQRRSIVGVGTLYKVLHKLERLSLISGEWVETPDENYKRLRLYTLTPKGHEELLRLRREEEKKPKGFLNRFFFSKPLR